MTGKYNINYNTIDGFYVERDYQVGDWVYLEDSDEQMQIFTIDDSNNITLVDSDENFSGWLEPFERNLINPINILKDGKEYKYHLKINENDVALSFQKKKEQGRKTYGIKGIVAVIEIKMNSFKATAEINNGYAYIDGVKVCKVKEEFKKRDLVLFNDEWHELKERGLEKYHWITEGGRILTEDMLTHYPPNTKAEVRVWANANVYPLEFLNDDKYTYVTGEKTRVQSERERYTKKQISEIQSDPNAYCEVTKVIE